MPDPFQHDSSYVSYGTGPYHHRSPTNVLAIIGFIISLIGAALGVLTCGMLSFVCGISLILCGIACIWEPRGFAIGGIAVSIIGLLPLMMLFGLFTLGAANSGQRAEKERQQAEQRQAMLDALPEAKLDGSDFETFAALNFLPTDSFNRSVSIAEFGLDGPDISTAIPTDDDVQAIAFDSQRAWYFAITDREFGRITEAGLFREIPVERGLDTSFSWPEAIAYLPDDDRVLIFTRRKVFSYSEATGQWELRNASTDEPIRAVAYDDKAKLLYALTLSSGRDDHQFDLVQINPQGAIVGQTRLSHPLPLPEDDADLQLAMTSYGAVVLVPPGHDDPVKRMQMFLIVPETGEVQRLSGD